jgi:ankyrin repeat protein
VRNKNLAGLTSQLLDSDGRTPLSVTIGTGYEAVVKLLLEKGAKLESRDNDGETPMSRAAGTGHEAAVKLLHSHA